MLLNILSGIFLVITLTSYVLMSNFIKKIIAHSDFYISTFSKKENSKYLLFIHGGPGLNCGVIEYLLEYENFFNNLNFNLVFYDQRGCGRSLNYNSDSISHHNNVEDLNCIYQLCISNEIDIAGFISHSYGSKLLFDYLNQTQLSLPSIFISTASTILTPRLNNFLYDLNYLKRTNHIYYEKILADLEARPDIFYEINNELEKVFHENPERDFLYWANTSLYYQIEKIKKEINLPINKEVFKNIRKDLYSNKLNYSVNLKTLKSPWIWINGFQDVTIGEPINGLYNSSVILFSKSSHYPHLEENNLFCEKINEFFI